MSDHGSDKTTAEPPWKRLLDYAELMLAQGRTSEAAEWALKARAMIYESQGVKDRING